MMTHLFLIAIIFLFLGYLDILAKPQDLSILESEKELCSYDCQSGGGCSVLYIGPPR